MIRVRLTSTMIALLDQDAHAATGCAWMANPGGDPTGVSGAPVDLANLSRAYVDLAVRIDGVKGRGTDRRTAIAAAQRIADALEKAARDAHAAIPISITVEEQSALRTLDARAATTTIAMSPRDRLARRGLILDDLETITARGRAVLDGTPPGDLVPFAFFVRGVRVRLAYDLAGSDGPGVWQELQEGHELIVDSAEHGRLCLVTQENGDRQTVAVEAAHPRIVNVTGRAP